MPAYSLNVPVPSEVARLAAGLATECLTAEPREHHTMVLKRLGEAEDYRRLIGQVRDLLDGTGPIPARVEGVDTFEAPPSGAAPVAYLDVHSRGLMNVHEACCDIVDPFGQVLEGDEYEPHVTIARGGDAGQLRGRDAGPIDWDIERIDVWDAYHENVVESISLT
ncbi:2'-5' RNA ligase family protein [Haloglomus halophilum]|uniref:2'-5' RNA ligase family protein n=1 Tax=Haloglomus halophilum TaxID=2962672 RepID=UPI0020C9A403|nr:2'-5' RNA ligase family protein [Haloglomus halophilum]